MSHDHEHEAGNIRDIEAEAEERQRKQREAREAEEYLRDYLQVVFAAREVDGYHDAIIHAYLTGNDGALYRLINRQTGRDMERVFHERHSFLVENAQAPFQRLLGAVAQLLVKHSPELIVVPRSMLTVDQIEQVEDELNDA